MPNYSPLTRFCLLAASLASAILLVGVALHRPEAWHPAAIVLVLAVACALRGIPTLSGYQFTAWIIAVLVAAMVAPQYFLKAGYVDSGGVYHYVDFSDKLLILTVVQLVMFGMGTQMSLSDFAGIARMPWSVLVGILCQFTIMPLVGFGLTRIFPLDDEVAAGIILIGCCSSGLASNVMAYLARANLALSITMTSVTTLLAPLMTPLWMKALAGDKVDISVTSMMAEIIKLVIVPIGAALLHDYLKHAAPRGRAFVHTLFVASSAWLGFLAIGGYQTIAAQLPADALPWFATLSYLPGAVVFGVLFHLASRAAPAIERRMPLASMFGIIYFTAVTTAVGRDRLLEVGGVLFLAAVIHNALGYVLGYGMSRALGVTRRSARTVAFEVGLQNGGMASGIANSMDKLGTMGLPAAVFSPWMNITGSILANYWRRHATDEGEVE